MVDSTNQKKNGIQEPAESEQQERIRPKIDFQKSLLEARKDVQKPTEPDAEDEELTSVVPTSGRLDFQVQEDEVDDSSDEEENEDEEQISEDEESQLENWLPQGRDSDPLRNKFQTAIPISKEDYEESKTRDRLDFQPFGDMAKAVATEVIATEDGTFDNFENLKGDETDILTTALQEYLGSDEFEDNSSVMYTDGSELGVINENHLDYDPENVGIDDIGSPEELLRKLEKVGYICQPFIASQISLLLNTKMPSLKAVMLEGPSGCGKSFLAKSLAKITGAELMTLQCYKGMQMQNLIEAPSTLAIVNAMAGKEDLSPEQTMRLGAISRAFLASQKKPVILLVDELDKVDIAIDTFFLGPIQDAKVNLESGDSIEANVDNLVLIFTKNMERPLNDALLRRVHPIEMDYMSAELERRVLTPHCTPQLVTNLVRVANIMRSTDGSYPFERPPAPEELLKTAKYIVNLLTWNITDFAFVGKNIWYMLAKSEHDRKVFESLLRFHPDFFDPLVPDGRKASKYQIFSRLGRLMLDGIIKDTDSDKRGMAYRPSTIGLTKVGSPQELAGNLEEVGYQCLPFIATQLSLLLNTPTGRVRSLLLEGPTGCGKSFLAQCLAKITGAHFTALSCYQGMETKLLIEYPSEIALSKLRSGETMSEEKLMSLGVLSRAFLKSQDQPTILLIDELDKVEGHIDTFFLGPIQDGRIWLESRPPLDANLDNLLIIFTKNYNRTIDQALLRRLQPIRMSYLDTTLERKILSDHCVPQLVANLVAVADRMRENVGTYQFERPPAPEELLTAGHYISKLLEWGEDDFSEIGRNVWAIVSKSEHDRAVLDHMLRFHPDFEDPLFPDGRNTPESEIHARLGRWVLRGIVADPDAERREAAWENYMVD